MVLKINFLSVDDLRKTFHNKVLRNSLYSIIFTAVLIDDYHINVYPTQMKLYQIEGHTFSSMFFVFSSQILEKDYQLGLVLSEKYSPGQLNPKYASAIHSF